MEYSVFRSGYSHGGSAPPAGSNVFNHWETFWLFKRILLHPDLSDCSEGNMSYRPSQRRSRLHAWGKKVIIDLQLLRFNHGNTLYTTKDGGMGYVNNRINNSTKNWTLVTPVTSSKKKGCYHCSVRITFPPEEIKLPYATYRYCSYTVRSKSFEQD